MRKVYFIFAFICTVTLSAENLIGMCGDSLQWSYNDSTRHLRITGSGDMNLTKYPAWTSKNIEIASIYLQYGITSVDSYAFEEQLLTEVLVPASVSKIGKNAFAYMPSLQRFEYKRAGYAETENGILYNCYNLRYFKGITRMISYNDALDTVIITYGSAFTNMYGPTYIDNTNAYDTRLFGKYDTTTKKIKTYFLPNQIKVLGDYLFCYATDLEGITIPNSTETIGQAAFLNCTSLDSLIFTSDAINFIGDSAFYNCTNLSYIRLPDTIPPTIEAQTFHGVDTNIPVFIPANCIERYKADPYWNRFINFVEPSITTAIETISHHQTSKKAHKCIENNHLIILHENQKYNVMGRRIK